MHIQQPNHKKTPRGTWLPWDVMLDIMQLSLEHTYIIMHDKTIWRQIKGIPMGDPLSPGLTIGTCAWMEAQWLDGIDSNSKEFFRAARYMDDILMFSSTSKKWDQQKFLDDFKRSDCYWKPLKLEDGDPGVYLETQFSNKGQSFRIKNNNEQELRVWRYHHYNSHIDLTTKKATFLATLKKVHQMASDSQQLHISAEAKLKEFANLSYPSRIRKHQCAL